MLFHLFLQVRITEGASLYSLCRSWLRNGAHEGLQVRLSVSVLLFFCNFNVEFGLVFMS